MGLFHFLKEAGEKLLGVGDAKAATGDDMKKDIQSSGLDASGLNVEMQGDTIKVTGTAKTQEEAEKIILSLGNKNGVAQVDTSGLKIDSPAPEATMYTVVKGDTLWKIAEDHYGKGHGAKYPEIVKANSPPVKNPDLIQPGWVLRIPPLAA